MTLKNKASHIDDTGEEDDTTFGRDNREIHHRKIQNRKIQNETIQPQPRVNLKAVTPQCPTIHVIARLDSARYQKIISVQIFKILTYLTVSTI